MQDDGDFLGPVACDQEDVSSQGGPDPVKRIVDGHHPVENLLLEQVHAERHDLVEKIFLAPDVMVEPRLREPEGGRDVAHGRLVEPLLAEEARRGLEDLRLAGRPVLPRPLLHPVSRRGTAGTLPTGR